MYEICYFSLALIGTAACISPTQPLKNKRTTMAASLSLGLRSPPNNNAQHGENM